MKLSWRWSRVRHSPWRPRFFYMRLHRRNPVDHKIVRFGPLRVRW